MPLDTVYSLTGEVPPIEATPEDAEASVFQPGELVLGSVREVCLIRKISAAGAILHADIPLEEGGRLELELGTGEHLDGTIAWRRGSELGLRFDEPIDVLPILARNLVSQPGERRRMPRVEVFCAGRLDLETGPVLVTIRDIAQGGAKIEGPISLQPEDRVVLTPEGLRPVNGIVRWSSGKLAGLAFEPELEWQELMPWFRMRSVMPSADFGAAPAPEPTLPIVPGAPQPREAEAPGGVHLNLAARVREGTRRWNIDVSSLTARTVEFDCYSALRLGSLLWIVLPGLEGWPARIVSIDGYRFTCEFTQALHPAVLERILASAKAAH